MDLTFSTNDQVCIFLASRIRHERLRQGFSQSVMAAQTGIPVRTYKRIELTGTGSITNLISILRTLERIRAIEVLFPATTENSRPSLVVRTERLAIIAQQKTMHNG